MAAMRKANWPTVLVRLSSCVLAMSLLIAFSPDVRAVLDSFTGSRVGQATSFSIDQDPKLGSLLPFSPPPGPTSGKNRLSSLVILAGECQSCVERSLTSLLESLRGKLAHIYVVHIAPVPPDMKRRLVAITDLEFVADPKGTIHRFLNPAFIPRAFAYDSNARLVWLQKSPSLEEVSKYASKN